MSPDIVQALEMGSNYAKFQGALNAVHIHFHPEGFSPQEVQSANKEYGKRFSKGLLLKNLYSEHPVASLSKIGNVKLNKALDVDTQEALVLTANRLLAIRTDLENVKLIDRALVYVEVANNNRSGEKAQTYLDTAEAMHKALNGNQAYTPFLNQESLPSNASVEVQQSLLESCRQQEQAALIMPCDNKEVEFPKLQCGVPEVKTPEMGCGLTIPEDKSGYKESRCGGGVDQRPKPEFQGPCINQTPKLDISGPCLVDQTPENLGKLPGKVTMASLALDKEVQSSEKVATQDTDIGEKEAKGEEERSGVYEGAYIDVGELDLTHPEAQVSLDAAVEQWREAENELVADVVDDHLYSASIQELIEKIQPLVDYFNNHPAVKKLGIYIDAETLVQHITQGEVVQGRKLKSITGVHDGRNLHLWDPRFTFDSIEIFINHGETNVLVRSIGEVIESKKTTLFGPDWTYERILKVILDAIENGRIKDPRIQSDYAGTIRIKTRCGMKIDVIVAKDGEISSFYPVKEWLKLRKNQVKCDGRCYKGLD